MRASARSTTRLLARELRATSSFAYLLLSLVSVDRSCRPVHLVDRPNTRSASRPHAAHNAMARRLVTPARQLLATCMRALLLTCGVVVGGCAAGALVEAARARCWLRRLNLAQSANRAVAPEENTTTRQRRQAKPLHAYCRLPLERSYTPSFLTPALSVLASLAVSCVEISRTRCLNRTCRHDGNAPDTTSRRSAISWSEIRLLRCPSSRHPDNGCTDWIDISEKSNRCTFASSCRAGSEDIQRGATNVTSGYIPTISFLCLRFYSPSVR
jgi:hypothetical protein